MVVLIGYAVAMGCIFGAYIIHGGNIGVILHALPTELMAILGGSLGAFAVNNQPKVLKATLAAIPGVLKGSKYSKARYMELMALLYDILQKARKEGLMAIESDVEDPAGSSLFQKYAVVGSDHHVVEFITDYLRMMVSGNLNAHEIESLMDSEIETHHAEAHGPVNALGRLAGALPAFGIVAAVLGVVNTMGSVGQPPAVLGGMIGSALVGTFLGILLAYADFVTAMMAFFLLMWLLGSTTDGDKKGIADFFNAPLKVALLGGSGAGDSSHVVRGGGQDLSRTSGQVKEGDVPSKRKLLNIKSLEAEQKRAEVTRLEALKKKV